MRIRIACVLALAMFGTQFASAQPASPYARTGEPVGDGPGTILPEGPGIAIEEGIADNCLPRLAWLRADYLVWFVKESSVPPLIQVIPNSLATASTLPAGAAATLFPAEGEVDYERFNGVRVNTGVWFDSSCRFGLDLNGFYMEQRSTGAAFASNAAGSPILARFYQNANNGVLTSLQFSNSDPATGYSGTLAASIAANSIYGFDANARWQGYRLLSDNTDYLAGFRYFDFRERLAVNGTANLRDGTRLFVNDRFAVTNQFYGGQLGLHARICNNYGFSLDGIVKFAVGGLCQRINISGDNTIIAPNGTVTTEATGLYARPSNIGEHSRSKLAVLPEFTVNLNYSLAPGAAIFVGYNMFWMNNVVRVGSTIDTNVNDANIRFIANPTPGTAPGPTVSFRDEDFWMHGLNLGLRLEY